MAKCKAGSVSLVPLLTGAVSGLLGGIMGVGGGVLLVPLFGKQVKENQHIAHGSSLAVIFFISLAGAIIYATRGSVDWILAMEIGAGSLIGVVIGAKLMNRFSQSKLRHAFGFFVIALAVWMLMSTILPIQSLKG